MATVIELLGGECTGKSALAEEVALATGAQLVPETLRAFVDIHGRAPMQDEQEQIMNEQFRAAEAAVENSAGLVVVDPSPAMTAVYSLQYFNDDSLLDLAIHRLKRADVIVWCQPDIPWVPDGVHRDGAVHRSRSHELLRDQVVSRLDPGVVVIASGDTQQRLRTLQAFLDR
ncbi:MAG TPA: ATP-binding protein [Candidatus Nanopelagicales bacterium]|nr:ATP-binding protein [Candidatus Nanopelagicales bacterium]